MIVPVCTARWQQFIVYLEYKASSMITLTPLCLRLIELMMPAAY